jgi:hypothetical protein
MQGQPAVRCFLHLSEVLPEDSRVIPANNHIIQDCSPIILENRKAKGMLIYTMQHPLST